MMMTMTTPKTTTNHWTRAALIAAAIGLAGCCGSQHKGDTPEPIAAIKLELLTKAPIEFAENVEVVMSRVAVPAGTTLPLHYHPGQEFLYILEGSGTLHLRDGDDVALTAGDHFMVPYKAVHTFTGGPNGGRAVVTRVHEKGQPERVPVDDAK